ncbi:ATP-dependent DNA helicase [Mycena venus]|uniref:ATP-dependent DNA helicase n=1 Tax=Mycena venus TaxID=2733690 RepID=A0A8H6XT44_9AGAR|nr:ATP-dependent DNA helicase [Mycena venus]
MPQMVGTWFPWDTDAMHKFYCASMLALLCPWRFIDDIKGNDDKTFRDVFAHFMAAAPLDIHRIVYNVNYFHECSDRSRNWKKGNMIPVSGSALDMDDYVQTQAEWAEMEAELLELTVADIDVAQVNRWPTRDVNYGINAVAMARNAGLFSDLCVPTCLAPEREWASKAQLLKYVQWGQDLAKLTQKGKFKVNNRVKMLEDEFPTCPAPRAMIPITGVAYSSVVDVPMKRTPKQQVVLDKLNGEQHLVHNIIEDHLIRTLKGKEPEQLLMVMRGEGGMGKTVLLNVITDTFKFHLKNNWLAKTGTTRVSVCLVKGVTLHSWARITIRPKQGLEWVDKPYPSWAMATLITPRHSAKMAWNAEMLEKHCAVSGERLYVCQAQDTKDDNGNLTLDETICITGMKTNEMVKLTERVKIAVGMWAMILLNIATESDLANSTRGTVMDIKLDPWEPDDFMPDDCKVPSFEGLPEGILPIVPSTGRVYIKDRYSHLQVIIWHQLALTATYAFTAYKSQGQTLSHVLIDFQNPLTGHLTPFSAYVALSQSKGCGTICLLRGYNKTLFTTHLSKHLKVEDECLAQLMIRTAKHYAAWWNQSTVLRWQVTHHPQEEVVCVEQALFSMSAPVSTLFLYPELSDEVLQWCTILDLVAFSLAGKFTTALAPFASGEHYVTFCRTLKQTDAVIVGCIVAMLAHLVRPAIHELSICDLNVMTPKGTFEQWQTWIQSLGGSKWGMNMDNRKEKLSSITECNEVSILTVVFRAQDTLQMTMIMHNAVIIPYALTLLGQCKVGLHVDNPGDYVSPHFDRYNPATSGLLFGGACRWTERNSHNFEGVQEVQ